MCFTPILAQKLVKCLSKEASEICLSAWGHSDQAGVGTKRKKRDGLKECANERSPEERWGLGMWVQTRNDCTEEWMSRHHTNENDGAEIKLVSIPSHCAYSLEADFQDI